MVWILGLMPTARSCAWITVPISTGCCMLEPDSGTKKVTSKPFGARFLEERLGLLRIVRIPCGLLLAEGTVDRRHRSCGNDVRALEDVADDGLLVDGQVHRLPHPLVLENRMPRIEGYVPDGGGISLRHRDVGILPEAVEAVGRHVDGEIDLARLDGGEPRLRLDDGHVDGLANLGRAAPVLIIAREDDLHPGLPRLELEGAGAHGILHDVLAVFLEGVGAVDEERLMREVLEERREGSLELDLHGERVDHLDALHIAEEALDVRVGTRL